ncbi:nitroreductase family protein [Promethearchaeum syntrophicum]|uniref:Nitroreductase family protein n=1 Tax=Promethearchaeum syntrophicum TaxID=2594042 RepID=A0A5B9D835_9ARCH|nr:nitroreductase family protein [Candidatus Prometheoarchaeum syntrophicum]QEE15294.1 malonic semialdehyde reductase [Candidatus Prometheoarchaeum syntrophicum]
MNVKDAIENRRAYRSLAEIKITEELINDLGTAAQLMPSCFNKQPWRFVFVYKDPQLERMKNEVLSEGNLWAKKASMIIAVFSKKEFDCVIKEREYYLYDTGMAVGSLLLRATEMGLIAHPIAGYNPSKAREVLNIPSEYNVINLIIIGKKDPIIPDNFTSFQLESEKNRPPRKPLKEFVFHNTFSS